jgi:predicted RNA-binding protein with PIN domain
MRRRWIVDGNNVMGARPDRWWNDRRAAAHRLAQHVAEWCRSHDESVVVVFDGPLDDDTRQLGGGNLVVVEARRRGRNAADHDIVAMAHEYDGPEQLLVVSSDRGLVARLPASATTMGAGAFRSIIDAGSS